VFGPRFLSRRAGGEGPADLAGGAGAGAGVSADVTQVLELQNTLDDLTHRVDKVKEENLKLKSENTVLGQYIENLMQASQVFQAVSPKSRRKHKPQNLGNVIKCTAKAVRGAVGGEQWFIV